MPEYTQKQIASKYKEDLTYYKKTHPMRRLRFWLTALAFVGGMVWALGFHKFGGTPQFFNTGPISENHSRFADRCEVCHTGATTDMLSILPVEETRKAMMERTTPILESLKEAGNSAFAATKENLSDPQKLAAAMITSLGALNLDNIDHACIVCHKGMALHQPGEKAVKFRDTVKELSVVAAGACSTCHKEHVGTARMKLPTAESCTSCHGDAKALAASLRTAKYNGEKAAAHGQNMRRGNIVQWIPPAPEHAEPKVIRSFADPDPAFSHPAFLYERVDSKDAAQIKFNHARHLGALDPKTGLRVQAKGINLLDGKALECSSCHTPEPDGVGMQRIEYAKHCQACHSLNIDPKLPGLNVPHRDPEKVRIFISGMRQAWKDYAMVHYQLDPQLMEQFWQKREAEFLQDWPMSTDMQKTLEDWQNRVFFTGIPPMEQAPNGQRLPACIKCHTMEKGVPVPKVIDTVIPEQWLTRGPFKHAAHLHLNCLECHGAAEKSRDTADISLPSQQMCAECHRPRDYARVETDPAVRIAPTFGQFSPEAAAKQRKEGGVFDSCLRCHKYHVPAAETEIANSLEKWAGSPH
jgi:hypothetical protein